jgi:hypothetical protein
MYYSNFRTILSATTWRYNPESFHLHTRRRKNLKYHTVRSDCNGQDFMLEQGLNSRDCEFFRALSWVNPPVSHADKIVAS